MTERLLPLNVECPTCRAMMQVIHGVYRCPWAKDSAPLIETGAVVQACAWPLRHPHIREQAAPPSSGDDRYIDTTRRAR